ncbi:hypothetical protein MF406_10505 [Georgenia sp. TF02-10]|uniref:hypothetical protein n=1 Tax=Georgenia sp. TF02-10 TaxID=2917725 RepID=UPI001FA7C685|nr:hypothetical protein [Georgenia sp. TF02-10]UNX53434.1 hypothetical protein MF406_10505 [Georgenia sp. TF02-10]
MARIAVGVSAGLATVMGIVGAVVRHGPGALAIGMVLVVAALGAILLHAVLNPESYGEPRFSRRFYRVWTAAVPLLAAAALLTNAASSAAASGLAYWSGFAAVAMLAGAVVGHRSTRAADSAR